MKKFLKGFSLAELMIVVVIISIIATMGIRISRRGVENAYNYYIYNGYKSLETAINNAVSKKGDACFNNNNSFSDDCLNEIKDAFVDYKNVHY